MPGRSKKGKNKFSGFSKNLAEARRGQYTQAELGELVGVGEQTIRKYESGERQPDSFDIIIRLAKELHVSADYLLGLSNEKNSEMRDIAAFIGVSQPAAAKLDELARRSDQQRNLPLNGMIMNHRFETLLCQLLLLHEEARSVQQRVDTMDFGASRNDSFGECTISGSDFLRYKLDKVMDTARGLFSEICMVDEAANAWDSVITKRLVDEYKKHVGGE